MVSLSLLQSNVHCGTAVMAVFLAASLILLRPWCLAVLAVLAVLVVLAVLAMFTVLEVLAVLPASLTFLHTRCLAVLTELAVLPGVAWFGSVGGDSRPIPQACYQILRW